MKKYKWLLFICAVIMIAVNLLSADPAAYRQLTGTDLVPVIAISAVIFLIKTGVLSGILIGIKKLWDWIRKE